MHMHAYIIYYVRDNMNLYIKAIYKHKWELFALLIDPFCSILLSICVFFGLISLYYTFLMGIGIIINLITKQDIVDPLILYFVCPLYGLSLIGFILYMIFIIGGFVLFLHFPEKLWDEFKIILPKISDVDLKKLKIIKTMQNYLPMCYKMTYWSIIIFRFILHISFILGFFVMGNILVLYPNDDGHPNNIIINTCCGALLMIPLTICAIIVMFFIDGSMHIFVIWPYKCINYIYNHYHNKIYSIIGNDIKKID